MWRREQIYTTSESHKWFITIHFSEERSNCAELDTYFLTFKCEGAVKEWVEVGSYHFKIGKILGCIHSPIDCFQKLAWSISHCSTKGKPEDILLLAMMLLNGPFIIWSPASYFILSLLTFSYHYPAWESPSVCWAAFLLPALVMQYPCEQEVFQNGWKHFIIEKRLQWMRSRPEESGVHHLSRSSVRNIYTIDRKLEIDGLSLYFNIYHISQTTMFTGPGSEADLIYFMHISPRLTFWRCHHHKGTG